MNKDKTLKGFAAASGEGASSGGNGVVAALSGGVSKSNSSPTASKKPEAASTTSTTTTAAPPTKRTKKRGPTKKNSMSSGGGGSSADNMSSAAEEETTITSLSETTTSNFKPLSLQQIKLRLSQLIDKLPKDLPEAPPDYDNDASDKTLYESFAPIKKWANTIQVSIEEYNLLMSLVAAATYKWGVDRSGASQQNLSVMNAELQQCQEVISNVVSPRLTNVLCPAVDVLIGEIEIIRDGGGEGGDGNGEAPSKKRKLNDDRLSTTATNCNSAGNEKRINHYTRPLVDSNYSHLCHCILARNAEMIRHTVATSIYTAQKVIGDYLNAMKKDSSHEASKGSYY